MTNEPNYRIGDRVRVVRELTGGVIGITATVVRLDTGPNVWIRPDEPVRIGVFAPNEDVLVGTPNLAHDRRSGDDRRRIDRMRATPDEIARIHGAIGGTFRWAR